ncbi:hypothetical protein Enr13x_05360 [Stieleria neptunia]|uniref:Uncharacterized protein n=1 Tax=Stieleria neptunia TaxID=2527979 RepID=A0A518HIT4_9BACT|nr:protein-disulfide reductase DsbD domain-containing protein [Stieleria neptunia]QDV40700.1 hypothetical protein Enr13x_05360 [Stieleria neptunia]
MTSPAMQTWLLLIVTLPAMLQSAEPKASTKFPAAIRVVESKPESPTHFTVRLQAERGVDIYAHNPKNDAWKHVAATLTIRDANGDTVDARVTYPDGKKIDTGYLGDLYVYRDSVDIAVAIINGNAKHPLSFALDGAGYNRLRSFCLGKMQLHTVRNQ